MSEPLEADALLHPGMAPQGAGQPASIPRLYRLQIGSKAGCFFTEGRMDSTQGPPSEFFQVVNFDRFQHYKGRHPPWIKLYNSILEDYEFSLLNDSTKLHLILIWLLASRMKNRIPWDGRWVQKHLRLSRRVDLAALHEMGFIEPAESSGVVARDKQLSSKVRAQSKRRQEREGEQTQSVRARGRLDFGFELFWAAYPLQVGKGAAREAWHGIEGMSEELGEVIVAAIKTQVAKDHFRGQNDPSQQFVPKPTTWIKERRWEDAVRLSPAEQEEREARKVKEQTDRELKRMGLR